MPERNILQPTNRLFSVHVWQEQLDADRVEWRGRVTAQPGGEIAYFRTWEDLIAYMQTNLDVIVTDNAAASFDHRGTAHFDRNSSEHRTE